MSMIWQEKSGVIWTKVEDNLWFRISKEGLLIFKHKKDTYTFKPDPQERKED